MSLASPALPYESGYKVDFQSRLAYHTFADGLASHRHILEAEEHLRSESGWSLEAEVRAYVEGAYAANPRHFGGSVASRETSTLIPQDVYAQYHGGPFKLRVGNQQVAWGEAFGAYYSDIVNPKDMRDNGLSDLAFQRLSIPMVNAQVFFGDCSLQLLYLPFPMFNMTPDPGSDFALPFQEFFLPGTQVSVTDNRSLPLGTANGEAGARFTALVDGFDLAFFYLNYHDRFPNYSEVITGTSPLSVNLVASHPRMQSAGFTGSKDLNPFVVRWETLYNRQRYFDAIQNGLYVNQPSDQFIGVLGIDFNEWENLRLGLQTSKTYRFASIDGAIYPQDQNLVTLRIAATLGQLSPTILLNYSPNDGSTLSRVYLTVPLSHQMDATLGADIYTGGPNSIFGLFRSGSRAFVQLHGYFGEG